MLSILRSIWYTFLHAFHKRETQDYPEKKPYLPPRYRGRIVLTRDADGDERCVACNLCAAACPVDCISLQATTDEDGRRYPSSLGLTFRGASIVDFVRKLAPTYAIQLIPDFEMGEYDRQNMVYEKENLLISGEGKYHGYNFYKEAGVDMGVKGKGEGNNEEPPVDIKNLIH